MTESHGQADDLKITPAMIEAGYEVANSIGPLGAICDPQWLEKAYAAMKAAGPSFRQKDL